jgi:hypothetical protein
VRQASTSARLRRARQLLTRAGIANDDDDDGVDTDAVDTSTHVNAHDDDTTPRKRRHVTPAATATRAPAVPQTPRDYARIRQQQLVYACVVACKCARGRSRGVCSVTLRLRCAPVEQRRLSL